MIIDGKKIAEEVKEKLKIRAEGKNLRLVVVWVGDNQISAKYIDRKKKMGEDLGVEVIVEEYQENIAEDDLIVEMKKLADSSLVQGIIVQLPLPSHIDQEKILSLIPGNKDVDALGQETKVFSPIIEAIIEILRSGEVEVAGRKAVVLGRGKLVGRPAAIWLTQEGAVVNIIHSKTLPAERNRLLMEAEIIVSGVGEPGLIKPDMISEGLILIDAATSESNGKLAGDADPACAEKCSVFTPVPGGVGPLTVVMLFKNLIDLATRR